MKTISNISKNIEDAKNVSNESYDHMI